MVEKAPTEKMGDIMVPQIHFKRTQNSGFFYVKADTFSVCSEHRPLGTAAQCTLTA